MPTKAPILAVLATVAIAAPATAQDAAKGEKDFAKCRACHMIEAPDGTVIQKGGKTGPNLYGVIGRVAGSVEGYAYSDSLAAVAATGTVWDQANLATYVANPAEWLKTATGDPAARTKMSFRLAKGAEDMAAYLASVGGTPAN